MPEYRVWRESFSSGRTVKETSKVIGKKDQRNTGFRHLCIQNRNCILVYEFDFVLHKSKNLSIMKTVLRRAVQGTARIPFRDAVIMI